MIDIRPATDTHPPSYRALHFPDAVVFYVEILTDHNKVVSPVGGTSIFSFLVPKEPIYLKQPAPFDVSPPTNTASSSHPIRDKIVP